jgi:Flp pilus assembly protein CpaB
VLAAIVVFSALSKRQSDVQRAMARTVAVVVATETIAVGAKLELNSVQRIRWSRDAVPARESRPELQTISSMSTSQISPPGAARPATIGCRGEMTAAKIETNSSEPPDAARPRF